MTVLFLPVNRVRDFGLLRKRLRVPALEASSSEKRLTLPSISSSLFLRFSPILLRFPLLANYSFELIPIAQQTWILRQIFPGLRVMQQSLLPAAEVSITE